MEAPKGGPSGLSKAPEDANLPNPSATQTRISPAGCFVKKAEPNPILDILNPELCRKTVILLECALIGKSVGLRPSPVSIEQWIAEAWKSKLQGQPSFTCGRGYFVLLLHWRTEIWCPEQVLISLEREVYISITGPEILRQQKKSHQHQSGFASHTFHGFFSTDPPWNL